MFTTAQLLCALLLSTGLAALLTCVARDLRATQVTVRSGLGGLMLILTIAVAHAATAMTVDACLVPPLLGWHWLPWAAIAVVPLMGWALPRRITAEYGPSMAPMQDTYVTNAWRWLAIAVVAAFGAWLLLHPMPFSESFTIVHLAGGMTAAAVVAIVTGIVQAPATSCPFTDRLTAIICSGGIAIGVLATGSKDLALLAGIIPMAILGGSLAALAIDRGPWSGGLLVTAIVTSWHLVLAASYSELPWWDAAIFALALPMALTSARFGTTPQRRRVWQLVTAVTVICLALLLALTLGQPAAPASDGPDYHY